MITGQVLRKERRDLDVTVTDLARELGFSRQHVHRIEKEVPSPERIEQYRAALVRARVRKG